MPKQDFLDCLKRVAERAKLNKNNFWLHKFRSTFATKCLQNGIDLRTTQSYLGHSDIESTLRYLKPARNSSVRTKMNENVGWRGTMIDDKRAHSLASKLLARNGLMRPEEVARILGVSKLTVLRWAKKGVLHSVRIQNMVMFDPGNLAVGL
jgi:hypothetical protein